MKQANKERLAHYVDVTLGLKVNTAAMFDVQIKVGELSFVEVRVLIERVW